MRFFFHVPTLERWKEDHFPDQKISFIKAVRTFYLNQHNKTLGLREAKDLTDYLWEKWRTEDEASDQRNTAGS
jgi:hypothetical protein